MSITNGQSPICTVWPSIITLQPLFGSHVIPELCFHCCCFLIWLWHIWENWNFPSLSATKVKLLLKGVISLLKLLTENPFISLKSDSIFVGLKITHRCEDDLHRQWKPLFPQGYLDDSCFIVSWQQNTPKVLRQALQVLNKLLTAVVQLISRCSSL